MLAGETGGHHRGFKENIRINVVQCGTRPPEEETNEEGLCPEMGHGARLVMMMIRLHLNA